MTPICIRVVPCEQAWRVVSDQWPSEAVDTLSSRGRAIAHALALAEAMRSRVKRAILVTVEGSEPSDPNTL